MCLSYSFIGNLEECNETISIFSFENSQFHIAFKEHNFHEEKNHEKLPVFLNICRWKTYVRCKD